MAAFLQFLKGPMVWVAFAVFFGGLIVQGTRFFMLTRRKEPLLAPGPEQQKTKAIGLRSDQKKRKTFMERLQPLLGFWDKLSGNLRRSMFATHKVVALVSVLFHVLLLATPLFLLAHNELWRKAWGVSLPSLAEGTTDLMTIVFLLCGLFFWLRRVFVRRVRAITTAYDHLVLLVAIAPFLTGFLAYRQWFDYQTVLALHILSGELMLMLIPFSKLGHMIYFFLYRLFVGGEYSFGPGRRAW